MSKKVVFVGVPMNGKDDAMIERAIQIAKRDYLRLYGLNVKDVEFKDNRGFEMKEDPEFETKHKRLMYLGNAIFTLSDCDEAVFGEGWEKANGCLIECGTCKRYGIPVTCIYRHRNNDKIDMERFNKGHVYRANHHISVLVKNLNGDIIKSEINP